MEIRDVIHGSIPIHENERPVIDSPYFQRLRHIKQMGFAEFSFPSASHSRYSHSIGTMANANKAFAAIFGASSSPTLTRQVLRFLPLVRLGGLLHDVGHGPLSHTSEAAMPDRKALALPGREEGQASHEDYTLKMITDSGFTRVLDQAGSTYGFGAQHIAAVLDPQWQAPDDFFREEVEGQMIDFRPLLHQIISSEIDADRMDYLRRDTLYSGVSYGHFDADWLTSNLTYHIWEGCCHLGLRHRALYTFEDFLLSRHHMFLMVYFHHKSVIYDEMLGRYFDSPECDFALPTDIEEYSRCTDADIFRHFAGSSQEWAKRITEKRPYQLLIEWHSGMKGAVGRDPTALKKKLNEKRIPFIESQSKGEISKYYQRPGVSIFVRYDNSFDPASFIPLEKCTDLFERYREERSITRIYIPPEKVAEAQALSR